MEASDSIHIVDALNAVSNNFALDTDNLAEILQRVSGSLEQTGTTMEEVIGLAVGGFTTLRNAEMVASGEYFCQYVQKCA
jgi:TP901 family phage tail tape measure protein